MNVAELIEQLSKVEDKSREVKIYFPGGTVSLHCVMERLHREAEPPFPLYVLGDVDAGSITLSR